jgi:hypothetical protein
VPFSTAGRFARRVKNIRAELVQSSASFTGELAWHWKRWAEMTEPGAVEQEFARQALDDPTLELLRRDGIVRSAAEVFAERLPAHNVNRDRVGLSRALESCPSSTASSQQHGTEAWKIL